MNNLAYAYRNGLGTPKDYEKAFYWFKKSAEQGNASGMGNLAYAYTHGLGTPKDYEKAFYWYKKSAEQGNDVALKNLLEKILADKHSRITILISHDERIIAVADEILSNQIFAGADVSCTTTKGGRTTDN